MRAHLKLMFQICSRGWAGVDAGVDWTGFGGAGLDTSGGIEKGKMGERHHHSHLLGPPG